jgi:hypothetical protein
VVFAPDRGKEKQTGGWTKGLNEGSRRNGGTRKKGSEWRVRSETADVDGFGALAALAGFEFHLLAFPEGAIAFGDDVRVVDKQVFPALVGGDEPEALLIIEPFDSTGFQLLLLLGPRGASQSKCPHQKIQERAPREERQVLTRAVEKQSEASGSILLFGFLRGDWRFAEGGRV